MNRRHFLAGILAAGAAPAIVRADSLMRLVVRPQELVVPVTASDIINIALQRLEPQLERAWWDARIYGRGVIEVVGGSIVTARHIPYRTTIVDWEVLQ